MNKHKIAAFASKTGFGVAVAAVIGALIKFEHRVDDRIDEHYKNKSNSEETE